MNQKRSERQREGMSDERLILSRTDEGFRVYSPTDPMNSYIVSGSPEDPRCTCNHFQHHEGNLGWRCKHIQAVLDSLNETNESGNRPDTYEREERLAIQNEGRFPAADQTKPSNGGPQMLLKRSVSPDGRIDSLSVEFSCSVEHKSEGEIKSRALNILKIQSEIADYFRKNPGGEGDRDHGASNGSVPARMVGISGINTRWGRRLFITVTSNGNTLKLFGSRKQLADSIVAAGFPNLAERVDEGVELNIPCRIVTKPSEDGKYLNIDRVFPSNGQNGRRGQA